MTNFATKLSFIILLIAVGIVYYQKNKANNLTQSIVEWGKSTQLKIEKTHIEKKNFKIEYDQDEWNELLRKLESTRYFDELHNTPSFTFGFNPEYAKELVQYWKTSFDWKKQVDRLNKYNQYRVNLNGTLIHYIHHVTNSHLANKQAPINLLLIDGWPGLNFGFHKMIDHIEKEYKDISFKIISASIPGYGYSTPLRKTIDLVDTAILFDALMRYENAGNYFVHGEDWGSAVATTLAQLYPNRINIHITMGLASEMTSLLDFCHYLAGQVVPSVYFTPQEIELNYPQRSSFGKRLWMMWSQMGYLHLQATKPDTVAHGLTDSPVGLMAYILEKYSSWTFDYEQQIVGKKDGGLEKFNKDELLSIITVYWMTNSISSLVRYYKANFDNMFGSNWPRSFLRDAQIPSEVRVGVQNEDNDLMTLSETTIRMKYKNLVQFKIVKDAGHFAAFEKPELTARNFIGFVMDSIKAKSTN